MGVLFIVMFIFIINTVYALSEEDKDFCKFVAEKVFTPGKYGYNRDDILDIHKTKDMSSPVENRFDKNNLLEYDQFGSFDKNGELDTCNILGQSRCSSEGIQGWSLVLEITYQEDFNRPQKIFIIPNKAESDNLIHFLQKVEWNKVIGEDRKSFKQVWNLDNTKERKRILEICHEKYSTNNEIMKCWGTELPAPTSQANENKQGDKNQQANDGQKTDKELQHLTSQTKEKEQEGEKIQQANNGQQNDEKKIDKVNNDEQKADDGEEKTIFANTCFTVSLTLTLGILWFFVLLYIRNTYCLTSTESQEEYEYEEGSTYDFV